MGAGDRMPDPRDRAGASARIIGPDRESVRQVDFARTGESRGAGG